MKTSKTVTAMILVLISATAMADSSHKRYKNHSRNMAYDFAKVVDVRPIYREIEVSNPVRECWDEPVIQAHGSGGHKSASGMAVGGILGGVIGHQIGKGNGKKLATAVGTILGAQIGHNAVNGNTHAVSQNSHTEYEQHCSVRHQVSYEEVLDGYRVTYRFQGEKYQIEMPYDPGKRIKLRIQIEPVI
jgi:uncharacterized protein YcfJ